MRRRRPAGAWPRAVISSAIVALAPATALAVGGASCSLSAIPLAFGNYVPASSAPTDFTATITVTCTSSGPAPVPISGTINLTGAGGAAGRHLTAGTQQLRYQPYVDPARSVPLGRRRRHGPGINFRAVGSSTPFRQILTVYGRILARQSAAHVGSYIDHFTVILNY